MQSDGFSKWIAGMLDYYVLQVDWEKYGLLAKSKNSAKNPC